MDASNLAYFYGSHIDGIICVKQIDLGSALSKDIKKILKFYKISSDFNFTVLSTFQLMEPEIRL